MSLLISETTTASNVRRVHVGCGPEALMDGWCNTDLRPFPGIDLAMDAAKPWPFTGLTHVFSEHFIEHLAIDQAFRFFVHAGNALAPGGRIRLSTPNLAWLMATFFSRSPETLQQRLEETINVNRAFYGWGHQFIWSEEMLRFVMTTLGYEHIESFAYGESNDPELRGLEQHRYQIDDELLSVVILEAVRGDMPLELEPSLDAWLEREVLCHVRSGH